MVGPLKGEGYSKLPGEKSYTELPLDMKVLVKKYKSNPDNVINRLIQYKQVQSERFNEEWGKIKDNKKYEKLVQQFNERLKENKESLKSKDVKERIQAFKKHADDMLRKGKNIY